MSGGTNKKDVYYALVDFGYEDIQMRKPEWGEQQCRDWLKANEDDLRDQLSEYGGEILNDLLGAATCNIEEVGYEHAPRAVETPEGN
jgi:hypothetical protein